MAVVVPKSGYLKGLQRGHILDYCSPDIEGTAHIPGKLYEIEAKDIVF